MQPSCNPLTRCLAFPRELRSPIVQSGICHYQDSLKVLISLQDRSRKLMMVGLALIPRKPLGFLCLLLPSKVCLGSRRSIQEVTSGNLQQRQPRFKTKTGSFSSLVPRGFMLVASLYLDLGLVATVWIRMMWSPSVVRLVTMHQIHFGQTSSLSEGCACLTRSSTVNQFSPKLNSAFKTRKPSYLKGKEGFAIGMIMRVITSWSLLGGKTSASFWNRFQIAQSFRCALNDGLSQTGFPTIFLPCVRSIPRQANLR